MLKRIQQKWKVSGWRFVLILITFAIGGSLTGLVGKQIMELTGIKTVAIYLPVYIIVVTLIWPIMVLLISIPLGQFGFFIAYLKKMGRSMGIGKGKMENGQWRMKNDRGLMTEDRSDPTRNQKPETRKGPVSIAIFASGAGSNAQQIISYFRNSSSIKIAQIICNKPAAGVLSVAEKENISVLKIKKEQFFRGDAYLPQLQQAGIEFIILAGFLWRIPQPLIAAYPKRIINIHPALLPNYGGKGMYGNRVHAAVIEAGDKESGITIHYVDEHYDNGDIIFQERCEVNNDDNPESLAQRIHSLEHEHFPKVIEAIIKKEFF
jgi:formyltetrahydrofolate-dependent phosphoribosylglycinamide formyltransferase